MSDIDLIVSADSPFPPWVRDAVRALRVERDDLRAEVKRLNAELTEADTNAGNWMAKTERLRDDARVLDLQHSTAVSGWEGMKARAEAAEAKVAKVEALAVEWADKGRSGRISGSGLLTATLAAVSGDIRDVLASVGTELAGSTPHPSDCCGHDHERENWPLCLCPCWRTEPAPEPNIGDTCCGKCPGGACYVDQVTGA